VAGLLYQTLLARGWQGWGDPKFEWPAVLGLGIVPIGVVLGLLDALFLVFVAVQFRYLFGGAALVEVSPTLTYAEYARRGFFELVTVTALALPLLLLADWLLRAETPAQRRVFQGLAGTMVALLGIIMISAVQRLRLYQDEFGLTEQRLYAAAFLGWLAIVLLWFAVTVLPGHRQRFAFGALLSAFAVIALLNVVNPDELIVRTNVGRATTAQPLDARYVTTLSADAVPALVENLALMREAERRQVASAVLRRWSPPASVDWRTWNWSRAQAWQAVGQEQAALQGAGRGER
jgi:hypothetical protein